MLNVQLEFKLHGQTLLYLMPGQRQILAEKVRDHDFIHGILTAELNFVKALDPYIAADILGILADRFPTLIDELRKPPMVRPIGN